MKMRLKRAGVLLVAGAFLCPGQAPRRSANDLTLKTGPAVGERIPAFEATDQNGKTQSFQSLKGAKGLLLLIVRSADW